MLSLKNLKSSAGAGGAKAVTRYAAHERRPGGSTGYYSQAGGAPSRWYGAGAAALGLGGRVAARDLERLLDGRIDERTQLTAPGKTRRMGVDLTFSAPKSVSLMGLAGGDERVLAAHDRAVAEALRYIESDVAGARRGKGGKSREATGNIIAAVYRHEDARPVDGRVDPQLHSHAILANATRRADGEWSAVDLDFGKNAVRMHIADEVFRGALERGILELGYETRRTEHGFEIAEITDEQIANFSRRREQIDAALAAEGKSRAQATAAERAAANLRTREAKMQEPRDEQMWLWRAQAREAGLDLDGARRRAGRGEPAARDLAAESVRAAVRHISERDTILDREHIILGSLRAGGACVTLDAARREIDSGGGGLLDAGRDAQGRQQYTTAAALAREQSILDAARRGRARCDAAMTAELASAYVNVWEQEHGIHLSSGQRAAVGLALASEDRIVGIVGAAGAGKTTAMRAVVDGIRARGGAVHGLAPTTQAAGELRAAGCESQTIAAWMLDADAPRGQTILVDEAGMISARGMERLIRRAGELDSRLLLVGDPKQLRAVEAGTPFAQMIESESIAHARIDEIQRQRDPRLREIAQSFSRGDARGAVRFAMDYATEVRVDGACAKPTRQERRAAIARATAETYLALSPEDRAKTLVLAGTNEVRRAVNEQIRAGIDADQEQSRESVTFAALDKADLTREQATRAEQYADAMIVTVTEARGKERRRRIAQYEVIGRDTEKNMLLLIDRETGATREFDPARERARGVYTQRDMDLAVGDRIMYREPVGRAKDPGGRVANGSAGTIVETDAVRRIAAVRLDNGRVREIDLRRAHAIDYAWARTVHSAQGATVDRAIVAGEASRVATAETAYVALSREREHLLVITDDKAKLAMSWSRYAEKQSAVEAAKNAARDFSRARLREMRRDLGRAGDLARARASEIERERERFFPAGI